MEEKIEFKVWDKKKMVWLSAKELYLKNEDSSIIVKCNNDDVEIVRYIGRVDMRGIKLFEGTLFKNFKDGVESEEVYKVFFDKDLNGYSSKTTSFETPTIEDNIIVVGHILNNPELWN